MDHISESIKETIDRVDGFITGSLIVDLENSTVELEQTIEGKSTYLPLTVLDHIQVRNGSEYITITVGEALERKDEAMRCSLFAGLYARVKKNFHEVKRVYELVPFLDDVTKLRSFEIESLETQYNKVVNRKDRYKTVESKEKADGILHELNLAMISLGYKFEKIEDSNEHC